MSYITKSLDGKDENGVRAEVRIEVGEGVVTSIEKKSSSAQVKFAVENFKQPVGAWVSINSPAFAEAQKSLDEKSTISYRIEVQRKPGIDRTTPIDDLRKDMAEASKNTKRVYAAINGVETDEAVTAPSEDPSYGGRYKASPKDAEVSNGSGTSTGAVVSSEAILASLTALTALNPTNDIVAAAVGSAIASGIDPEKVFAAVSVVPGHENAADRPERRNSFSSEAAAWKQFNTDGTMNLGHMRFSSGVSSESFVRVRLAKAGLAEEELADGVGYFTRLVLSITDRVQVKTYGEGSRADRGAQSHARIRGIVYDTIENYAPLPYPATTSEPAKEIQQWVAKVGRLVYERFIIALQSTDAPGTFIETLPQALYPNSVQEPKTQTGSIATVDTTPKKAPSKTAKTVTPELVEEQPPVVETPAAADESVEKFEKAEKYPVTNISTLPPEKLVPPKATKETQDEFVALVKETEISREEYSKVSDLVMYTFGSKYNKIAELPEPVLTDFLDFYITTGTDNFRDVIQNVPAQQ